MDVMRALLTRRSIRKYVDRPVDKETLERILEAAMYAPTAGDQRTWQFVVVDDRAILKKIPEILRYGAMAAEAAVAVLVCGDTEKEKFTQGYIPQDAAAASQNILLAAHALGLGAVWCGVHPRVEREEGFRKLLSIPAHIVPVSLICMGWPGQEAKPASDRFDRAKIHYNAW